MPFLSFVSDEALQAAVDHLLTVALEAMNVAEGEFNKNVVDPFAALFEMSGFGVVFYLVQPFWRVQPHYPKYPAVLPRLN